MTISQNKKVSVIVPNYNYAKYVGKRIDSIVRQTYPVYELIVLDDCSTDGSVEVIEKKLAEVRKKYPELKVRFEKNNKNSGKAMRQWKKGLELATGEYVWIAEADDLCKRKFLEEVMKGFCDPGVVLSYTESAVISGRGIMIAPNFRWSRDKEKTGHYKSNYIKDGKQEIEEIMAIRCTIPNVSAVVFKNDKKYLKYLEEALKFAQVGDWYFYLKVLETGKISYNKKSLNCFRVHSGSVTDDSKNNTVHCNEIVSLHKWIREKYRINETVSERMNKELERVKKKHDIMN